MEKIIQIAACAAENGHSLYALTQDGKVYERVYPWTDGVKSEWEEIKEVEIDKVSKDLKLNQDLI